MFTTSQDGTRVFTNILLRSSIYKFFIMRYIVCVCSFDYMIFCTAPTFQGIDIIPYSYIQFCYNNSKPNINLNNGREGFNENNFSKVQRIFTFIREENFLNPFRPCRILQEDWDTHPSPPFDCVIFERSLIIIK